MMGYKAYTRKEASKLGLDWSPDPSKEGYVFATDITGRFCHVASCQSYNEAIKYAKEHNLKSIKD